jgi:hypothetical protein
MSIEDTTPSTAAIRKLTAAVWVLALALLVNALAIFGGYFVPALLAQRVAASFSLGNGDFSSPDEFNDFHAWPIEKQIQKASVIAVATYKNEDGKLKAVISSILKQAPNTHFYYKVGDEYAPESRYPRESATYGDGQVMFFTGSPAMMRYSVSYSAGRIGGLGDLPLDKFGDMVKEQE